MAIRGASAALFSFLVLGTACTAVLGVEDVPPAPAADGGGLPSLGQDSGGTPDSGGGTDLASAVRAYVTARCAKFRECNLGKFDIFYRDQEDCVATLSAMATGSATLPGATATVADFQGCTTRAAAQTCDTFNSSDLDFVCPLKGSRKAGEKCISGYQCETGICATSLTTCRTCVTAKERGADCSADGVCGPGLRCNSVGRCVTESTLNQSCSDTQPCISSLVCLAGACRRQPETANAPCTSAVGCALDRGLFCLDDKCVSFIVNGPSGECNYEPATGDQPKLCRQLTPCVGGLCQPPPNVNEGCGDFENGLGLCKDPLVCLNSVCVARPSSSFCE